MIQKFQQGGNAMMQFVQGLAQTLQANPDEVIQIAQQNPEALQAAVQIFQQTKDMGQAAKAFQQALQQKTQAMKHGAKLQYLKSLKNQCAEDEELYYYKKGGSVGCGCKKKEKGGEVTSESPITKFKKARKMLNGGKDSTEVNYPDPTEGGKKVYDKKTKTFRPVTSEDKNNWKKNLKDATQGKGEGTPERGGEPVKNYRNSIEKKLKKYEKKKCGGEMKPKLAKRGEKACPKCGKVHSAKIGCTVAKFKQAYKQGGQL